MPESNTILLVEDNPKDIILIKRAIRKANLANPIQVADNGEKAVHYLAGEGEYEDRECYPIPILILLDLKLPRKSGFEVLTWLREQPNLKRLPVVILTSSNQTIDINLAYDLGVNSYLVKPVAFDALVEMVQSLGMYWLILSTAPEIEGASV